MKQKKAWPIYIQEALEGLDAIWSPDQSHRYAQVISRYLDRHSDALLRARYDMGMMYYYMISGQRDKMHAVMAQLGASSLLSQDDHLKGQFYLYSSRINYYQADGTIPLRQAEEAVATFRQSGNKKGEALSLIQIYNVISTFDLVHDYEPIGLLWEVITICDQLALSDEVVIHLYSIACPGIAFLYTQEDKHTEALAFLQEPYRKLSELKSPKAYHIRMLMGSTLYAQGDYQKALDTFLELYDPDFQMINTSPYLFVSNYLIRSALATGTLHEHVSYYHDYLEKVALVKQPLETVKANCIVAEKEASEGNASAALAALADAKELITTQNMADHLYLHYYETKWKVCEMLNDYRTGWEAYRIYERYLTKSKSSLTDKKIEVLKNRIEMTKRATENEILRMDLHRNERELELAATYLEKKNALIEEVLTFTNVLSKKHKHQNGLFEIRKKLISIKAEDTDRDKVRELLDKNNQEYIRKITAKHPSITGAEAKICALIKAGLGNKEIASLLVTSPRTVDTHRSNIRRKMGLSKTDNLERALRSLR